MNRLFRRLALMTLLFGLGTDPAQATYTLIDNFAGPNPAGSFFIPFSNPNPYTQVDNLPNAVIRTSNVTVISAPGGATTSGSIGFDSYYNRGTFNQNAPSQTIIRSGVTYTNFNNTSGNFAPIQNPTSFVLSFIVLDPGRLTSGANATNMPVDIAISTTAGGLRYFGFLNTVLPPDTLNPAKPYNFATDIVIPFSQFSTNNGTPDFKHITNMTITFNDGANNRTEVDYVLAGVGIDATLIAPAPPTWVAVFAVPVLARIRRLRRA